MPLMKEQDKTPEKELNETETSNLPDAEFGTLVLKMFKKLRRRIDQLSENFNKNMGNIKINIENLKKGKSEMKCTITEMKSILEESNNRLYKAED